MASLSGRDELARRSHWCDLAEFVSGETFVEANAAFSIAHETRPVGSRNSFGDGHAGGDRAIVLTEDIAIATLRTTSGILANTVVSQVSGGRKNRLWLELDGSQMSAVFDQENPESVCSAPRTAHTSAIEGKGSSHKDRAA